MSTPTFFMGLPNPSVGADATTWGGFLNTCITGFDTLAAAVVPATVTATGNLAVYNGQALIEADSTGGSIVLTLPDATVAANKGRRYSIVKVDSTGNTVQINPFSGGQTISGAANIVLSTQWSILNIVSDGAKWVNADPEAVIATPISVPNGGTGDTTMTLNGVLYGNGTNPILATAQGAANSVLTANAGAPVFSATPTVTSVTTTGAVVVGSTVSSYNGVPTVAAGVVAEYAQANLTAQAANIAATTLYAVPASGAGLYRVDVLIAVSQAATTSSTMPDSRITYTTQDGNVAVTTPVTASNTGNTVGTTFAQATFVVNAHASSNIQFDVGQVTPYASAGATAMNFVYRARLEFLG